MFSSSQEKSSQRHLHDLFHGVSTVIGAAAAGAATGYAAGGVEGARAAAITGAVAGVAQVVNESPSFVARLGAASAAAGVAVLANRLVGGGGGDAQGLPG